VSDEADNNEPVNQDEMADAWAEAMEEQATTEEQDAASSVALPNVSDESLGEGNQNIDVVLDIPVTIAMEVGQTSISIRNLLQLNQGSVIELDRLAGEPLDVLVNGTLIAHGEVVVVNEKFGIRMTDVISPSERIKRLR